MRGTHVQAQEAERREIALAQQTEFHVLGRGLRSVLRSRDPGPEQEKKEERRHAYSATASRVS